MYNTLKGRLSVGYSENVKNYNSIRSTLRELYIDGYKTRNDYISATLDKESSKSVDNRIRRVLNIIKDLYSRSSFSEKGKTSYISIDSRTDTTNPLYKTFEAKSFDKAGLIMYFLIIELLSDGREYLLSDIEQKILNENNHDIMYWGGQGKDETPHRDTLRNWLNKLVDCGILQKTKKGNKDVYSIVSCNIDWREYALPISFFSEIAPLGIFGSFIEKDIIESNDTSNIIYKHHFIVSAIDTEILEILLTAIKEHKSVEIKLYKYDDKSKEVILCTPIKVYSSTRSGRQYVLVYNNQSDAEIRFQFIRLDKIKSIRTGKSDSLFPLRLEEANELIPYIWGVKLPRKKTTPYTVSMTIAVKLSGDKPETYIVDRLRKEGRGGIVKIIDDSSCRYEKKVFCPEEMLPWIRTFYGRILAFDCDDPAMGRIVIDDIKEMYGEEL